MGCDDWVFRLIKDHMEMCDRLKLLSARVEILEIELTTMRQAAQKLLGSQEV
jgi:hypothetical protein